jgi:hypothetical protein
VDDHTYDARQCRVWGLLLHGALCLGRPTMVDVVVKDLAVRYFCSRAA